MVSTGDRRIGVVIPALNEAASVGNVVHRLLEHGADLVVVADNGSTDGTGDVAAAAGATVVREERKGYGYACAAGAAAVIEAGATVVVWIDGDGSSRPEELGDLLTPLDEDRADLVLGSRVLGEIEAGAMGPHQRFGNAIMAALMRRLYGLTVTDLGPYRAIRAELLESLAMSEMTFGWPTEMTVKCARRDARIVEVPVAWDARREGKSKVSGTIKGSLLAGWHIGRVTLRHVRGGSANAGQSKSRG